MTNLLESVTVRARCQGRVIRTCPAIGRKGNQILVAYHISTGEPRERWLSRDRILSVESGDASDLDRLPRYRVKTCRGVTFDPPAVKEAWLTLRFAEWNAWLKTLSFCGECRRHHRLVEAFDGGRRVVSGRKSRKVRDERID